MVDKGTDGDEQLKSSLAERDQGAQVTTGSV